MSQEDLHGCVISPEIVLLALLLGVGMGSSYTITSSGSGTTVQCTASETSASSIDLTLMDYTQSNIRVRACTSSGDSLQNTNSNVALSISRIGVTISPLTASQGDTLTASYSGYESGTPTWLCYISDTSKN